MRNKKKVFLTSVIAIVVCLSLVVVGTYALFTDSINLNNHLQAGALKVKLERTNLKWTELDFETGYLIQQEDNEVKDFSKSSSLTENIFGLGDDVLIVPDTYYEATMKLSNDGNIAFEYEVKIVLKSDVNALAEQLKVTIDGDDSNAKLLSEGETILVSGTIDKTLENSFNIFTIRVELLNQENSNDAQNLQVDFDLIITAVQSTT